MKNKVLKTVVVILSIIAMTMSDFLLIGTNLVSYAASVASSNATNHDNVKFAAYFKNEQGEKLANIDYAMNNSDMRLYMAIEVKNEGYFDGTIFLDNSNFMIKPEFIDKNVNKIDGNTITLKRVTAGNLVEIELQIKPIIKDYYEPEMLNMESEIQISGIYKDSTEKNINIHGTRKVALNLMEPEDLQTTLQARVLTNKIYKIGTEDKRLVQLEIKSGIVQNAYPVKSTTLEIQAMPNVQSLQISTKGTLATNGEKETVLEENSYKFDEAKNLLTINIENASKDGRITWKKNIVDTIIATFILNADVQITADELKVNSRVQFYGQKEIKNETIYKIDEEKEGIIEAKIQNKEASIYKGKLYSKEQRQYETTTNIEVNYAGIAEYVNLKEQTKYNSETEQKLANIWYIKTTISKAEIEKVLGEEGILKFKDQDGNLLWEVTSNLEADENGNITFSYNEGVKELLIEASQPVQVGTIRISHIKEIKAEEFTREEIKTLKEINQTVVINSSKDLQEHVYNGNIELKEPISTANLSVVPQTLSTTTLNEKVKIALTLKTDNEKYELYKNPNIKIKLPESVKSIHAESLKANKLYLDDFKVKRFTYALDTHEIEIKLLGEQKTYTGSNTNGYIEIIADIELEDTTPNKKDKIVLTYTNENTSLLENGGVFEVPINITGYNGLVALNSVTNYNLKGNSITKEEQVANLKTNAEAVEANFQIVLLNNTGDNVQDVKTIGNFPVYGTAKVGENTFENTIPATLKTGINTNGVGTVYYTANPNATDDLNNSQNGWTTKLQEVENPTLYMIKVDNMEKESNLIANYTMQIPENLSPDKEMKTSYEVNYVEGQVSKTVEGVAVGLETGRVLVTLQATVGGEELKEGDTVKAGEVIRYKINVTNNGASDATNIKIRGLVPEGTVFVEPNDDVYISPSLYFEEDDSKTKFETTIDILKSGESKEVEYLVRAKSDVTTKAATNKVTATYNDGVETNSNTINILLQSAQIRVTIKRALDTNIKLIPFAKMEYWIVVENLSDIDQENLKLKTNFPEELTPTAILKPNGVQETDDGIIINNLSANSSMSFEAFFTVNEVSKPYQDITISAIVEKENQIYRSNAYKDIIYGQDVEMTMSATHEGETLVADDYIEYEIIVKSNSIIDTGHYSLEMNLPKQLTIEKIEQNGEEKQILDENYFYDTLQLEANATIKIKITAIVNFASDRFKTEKILSSATLRYIGIEKITTEPVVHYLKGNIEESLNPENPPIGPADPEEPTDPNKPTDPEKPPVDPEDPVKPEVKKYNITGKVWLDKNKDGAMNGEDNTLKGITIKLLDVKTNQFVKNSDDNKILEIMTKEDGYYIFENIPDGKYIVVFEYDNILYKPTTYEKSNIAETENSNAISKSLTIEGKQKEYAVTDEIELKQNVFNLNLGLVFAKRFEVKTDKYISKVIVQTSRGTTTYDYQNKNFVKVEISPKQMIGATILVQYTIKVTNTGDVDAYVGELVDYAPNAFKFSSELNKQWYEKDNNLYTNTLEYNAIKPGESKEIKLVLTKTKTDGKAERINNMAEIQNAYNIYGIEDVSSIYGNKNKDEKDLGSADLLISIQTGQEMGYIILVIAMIAVIGVASFIINKKIMKIEI